MYLMGLSSAGYLGGKFARKPGPVLNEISVTPSQSDMALAESAVPPPDIVPNLTPHLEPARAVLKEINGRAASQPAKTAVGKLATAVADIENVRTEDSAVKVARELENAKHVVHEAASAAATEFANAADAEAKSQAEIAQRAAAALYDLASALTQMLPRQLNRAPGAPAFTRTIELRGRNLSPEGLLQIDGMELPFRMLVPDPADPQGKRAPVVVVREPDIVGMAVVLRLTIDPAQLEPPDLARYKKWFERDGAHTFRLINLDGQQDDLSFTVPPGAAQSEAKAGIAAAQRELQAAAAGAGS
jgi:flagellar hook-length control protein FliK